MVKINRKVGGSNPPKSTIKTHTANYFNIYVGLRIVEKESYEFKNNER